MDTNTEFFEAFPTDGLMRRLARLDMSADEVPAVGIPPTRWMAVHQEHETVAHKAATAIGIRATMAGVVVTAFSVFSLWGGTSVPLGAFMAAAGIGITVFGVIGMVREASPPEGPSA